MKIYLSNINLQELIYEYNFGTYTADHIRIYELMREFVASSSRGKRREKILNKKLGQLHSYPILERLVYDNGEVRYVGGCDYPREMGIIRDIFCE